MFNHTIFKTQMSRWVFQFDDPDFNRAWHLVIAVLQVHADLDRGVNQSPTAALSEIWSEFAEAFEDEPATYTVVGLFHEFRSMKPPTVRQSAFDAQMQKLIANARDNPLSEAELAEPLCNVLPFKVLQGGQP